MMAFAPWVSVRLIDDTDGSPGFFYVSGAHTTRQTNTLSRHLQSAFTAHTDPLPAGGDSPQRHLRQWPACAPRTTRRKDAGLSRGTYA